MKGRKGIAAPSEACTACGVRKRMNSSSQCAACYRDTPTPGNRVTDAMRDQLHTLWQQSIDSQFRRD